VPVVSGTDSVRDLNLPFHRLRRGCKNFLCGQGARALLVAQVPHMSGPAPAPATSNGTAADTPHGLSLGPGEWF
jgi:hypothetical protein